MWAPVALHRLRRLASMALLACLAAVSGCGEDAAQRLGALAPQLDREMARRLVSDTDEDFARYCADIGIKELIDARLALRRALLFDSPESYARSARALQPSIGRISEQLASQYGCVEFLRDDQFWMGLSAADAAELGRLEAEMNRIYLDPELLLSEKAELLRGQGERFRSAGYWMGAAVAEFAVAEFAASLGNEWERERYLRRSLDAARRGDLTIMTAQILGALGSYHLEAGRTDSMAVAWNESMVIATRHRLPEHAAAIISNYAAYYASQGRLALAADRYAAAQEICREYKGGYLELRFILETLFFHAEYGHIEVVQQLIQRARVLHRESARSPREVEHRVNGLRLDEMEGRFLMSQGRVEEANQIFTRLEGELRGLPNRYDYVQLLYAWSQGLLDNRRPGEGLPVIGRGLVQSVAGSLPATRCRFLILLARALRDLGNTSAALQTLGDFRRQAAELGQGGDRAIRDAWIAHDECLAAIHLARKERAAACEALRAGLARMGEFLLYGEAGTQGYAFLSGCDELRRVMHAYLRDDVMAGYALELSWRRLPLVLGAASRENPESAAGPAGAARVVANPRAAPGHSRSLEPLRELERLLTDDAPARARQLDRVLDRLRGRRAMHLVYAVAPKGVTRWAVGPEGGQRDTLGVAPEELRGMVARALALVSRDPGDIDAPPESDLARLLYRLAVAVLPPELLSASPERAVCELLISPDGFLGLLPFAAYNLDSGEGYAPLIDRCTVAYLRLDRPEVAAPATGPGVILADPLPADPVRRRYPALGDLRQTMREVDRLAAARGGTRVLARERATRAALFQVWGQAPFVYVAAHFIRDPELPYLTFLPLSQAPGSPRIEESYLDVGDIRTADLRRCALVVLSGCASGAPYVTAGKTAPGLGDALVDAGVSDVVDTFWRVRDDEAAHLMQGFIQAWAVEGQPPELALPAAQRAYLHGPRGARHPFTWAAYAVRLGRL